MLDYILEVLPEPAILAGIGLLVGLLFGAAAQRSEFCLRAATVELANRAPAKRMAVWLLVFFAALALTQLALANDWLRVTEARAIAATGSLSGALIGGALFGVGMILARGCASRLLVLSGTGNLRALLSGLVLTLVAQASLSGGLSPLRLSLSRLWTIEGGSARLLWNDPALVALIGGAGFVMVLPFARRMGLSRGVMAAAALIGLAVTLGWVATYQLSLVAFDPVPVSSVTFTGPATDTLMGLVTAPSVVLSFGTGLVPGVFVGSAVMALLTGRFRIERFGAETGMERYLIGAALMGFGSMLAGGCAVGAGLSGGAILSLTAWTALASMWGGAMTTHLVLAALAGQGAQPSMAANR